MIYRYQPLGTIIASVLEYDKFCQAINDSHNINNKKSTYVPCDGRTLNGSKLEEMGVTHAPDLRGRFLRGLNVMYNHGQFPALNLSTADPEGEGREAGSYQADEFKSHSHKYDNSYAGPQAGYGDNGRPGPNPDQNTGSTGGLETRPRNVAVFYYIKIN